MGVKNRVEGKKRCFGILRSLKAMIDRNRLGELLVIEGFITPLDLRFALNQQKTTTLPLGQVLVRNQLISRFELGGVLARQWTLRCLAAMLFCSIAVPSISLKKAWAEVVEATPAVVSYPALFGTDEKRSGNLTPFTKWTEVLQRSRAESDTKAMQEWQIRLAAFKNLSLTEKAARVNDMMNEKPYILDSRNWGQSDYWETPAEFLKKGGDCEDFAIAKYTALRSLGVPEERLRLAIVHDNIKNIPHAVLIVYTEERPYVLDNQIKRLVNADAPGRYRPIYSINRQGWWLHSMPEKDATVMASVQ